MLLNAEAQRTQRSAQRLMPRRRRGGMGWETWQSDSAAEARGKKRPSCARVGRLKPAPPRQVTGEEANFDAERRRAGVEEFRTRERGGKKGPSFSRIGRLKPAPPRMDRPGGLSYWRLRSLISKSLGQRLPVTKRRSCWAS